ncbi:predicted protein [Plenodomus lingam JN3]|uniref:Predicted protein n=1 Tax=Leptosphaeria maculans (strain JN3 / isolate v23.1.3 / race Av1-4-5-6-7-8) TaxID=985895 RepID=E5ABP0_LEPMJ|nr:predicted protein [Plenodomus lingam JN3]CBY01081.1 predicted protein [Plenodomus lingam JN3]
MMLDALAEVHDRPPVLRARDEIARRCGRKAYKHARDNEGFAHTPKPVHGIRVTSLSDSFSHRAVNITTCYFIHTAATRVEYRVRAVDRSENEVVSVTAETGDWRLETGDWRLDFQSSLASPSPTPFEGEQRAKLGLVEFASGRLMEKIIIRHENPSAAHVHRV